MGKILKPEVGTILFTKDGRMFGNAIITDETITPAGEGFVVKSDYGSKAIFTPRELREMFYFDFEQYDGAELMAYRASHKFVRTLINT